MSSPVASLAAAIRSARVVTALTGAGISTDSGIPDFRGPQGIWTKDPKAERLSNISHYMADRDVRVAAWKARLDHPAWTASPNPAHHALVELERRGALSTLITQNVDGLHVRAGTSPDILVEIHGSLREVMCMSCGERAPMERALERVRGGEEDPPCQTCGGILKSATISFGQNLVRADLDRAQHAAAGCDVFLALGTSLTVFPVAYLPQLAVSNGAALAIVNAEPTPYDDLARWVIRDPLSQVLPSVVSLL